MRGVAVWVRLPDNLVAPRLARFRGRVLPVDVSQNDEALCLHRVGDFPLPADCLPFGG